MQHILCRSEVVSASRLQELRQRYPQLIRSTEKLYPAEEGNIYYEPQLRVKNGAAVHCPYKGCGHLLRYRDLRIVTRRIDAHRREVYFLERCCCPHCRKQGRQSYHMLSPDVNTDITVPISRTITAEKKQAVMDDMNIHTKAQNLAKQILEFKKQRRALDRGINDVEQQLSELFDDANVNELETDMGILTRRKIGDKCYWVIEI